MAIDEKKLIDVDKLKDDVWKYALTCKNTSFEFARRMSDIEKIIDEQPKISLENKTSDNDVPDTNVGKMDREFEKLEVTYPPDDVCTYPEYRGKPYFAIKYKENGEHFVGYGTYKPEVLSRYLRDYFMPLAMPKESNWIPVTERLPEENGRYIVTLLSRYNNRYESFDLWYEDGSWYECNYLIMDKIIAWMPLPPAYEGAE